MTTLTRAELRHAIKHAERALHSLDTAQERLDGSPSGRALGARLEPVSEALWAWIDGAISLRDDAPGAADE